MGQHFVLERKSSGFVSASMNRLPAPSLDHDVTFTRWQNACLFSCENVRQHPSIPRFDVSRRKIQPNIDRGRKSQNSICAFPIKSTRMRVDKSYILSGENYQWHIYTTRLAFSFVKSPNRLMSALKYSGGEGEKIWKIDNRNFIVGRRKNRHLIVCSRRC